MRRRASPLLVERTRKCQGLGIVLGRRIFQFFGSSTDVRDSPIFLHDLKPCGLQRFLFSNATGCQISAPQIELSPPNATTRAAQATCIPSNRNRESRGVYRHESQHTGLVTAPASVLASGSTLGKDAMQDLLARGFSRRSLGRFASLLGAGAALPFFNEGALAQLSQVKGMPFGRAGRRTCASPSEPLMKWRSLKRPF
jgi:hypothetical protein